MINGCICLTLGLLVQSTARAEPYEKYGCEREHFLGRAVSQDDMQIAHWITSKRPHFEGGCHFVDGHKIRLGDIALWSDKTIADKGVWVYHGRGNNCSEHQLLIFNEQTHTVMILDALVMAADTYECTPVE
jgi:hypothetical protein